jgi:glycosyltransferase involved in cell wall biosynthesis
MDRDVKIERFDIEQAFLENPKKHILMITNHGIHQWDIVPGLVDTGGQNIFVNEMTRSMTELDFKVTIVNRGGFPHPVTGEPRSGVDCLNPNQRILFIEDGKKEFVRKEDMIEQVPELVDDLYTKLMDEEGQTIDLIISHYWDGAKIGVLLNERLTAKVQHVWIPHSLGNIKIKKLTDEEKEDLRIFERIEEEKWILERVDSAAYTSKEIKNSLEKEYGCTSDVFLPPCIDTDRYFPKRPGDNDPIWRTLAALGPRTPQDLKERYIITEISRTDHTKRKDVLIKAFGQVHEERPDTVLIVAIDEKRRDIAHELHTLIDELDLGEAIIPVGSVRDELPDIYSVTSIYCSPSVMEGFGMSVQEAAASGVAVVASDLVPYAKEYLLGSMVDEIPVDGGSIQVGEGAVVVPADNVKGFAEALLYLLNNMEVKQKMAVNGYRITIPQFTWEKMTRDFLLKIGFDV